MFLRKKEKLKYLVALIIVIVSFVIIVITLEKMHYFRVKKIIVNGKSLSKADVELLLKEERQKNIYSIDINKIIKRVKGTYKAYSVEIIKKYPDTLIVSLVEKDIIALLHIKNKSTLYAMNKNARIIKYLKKGAKYPIIKSNLWNIQNNLKKSPPSKDGQSFPLGGKLENKSVSDVLFRLYIIKKINIAFFYQIKEINIFDDANKNYFLIRNMKTKFFFGEKIKLEQLMKVASLLKTDFDRIKHFSIINLRFTPIIAREETK